MKKLKIGIIGAKGTLGTALMEMIGIESNHDMVAISRGYRADSGGYERWESDQPRAWKEMAENERWRTDYLVNTAALTDVDLCEVDRESAWKSNVELVEHALGYCRKSESRLIQVSTDYVFDGESGPYRESDRPEPINYYGRTKLAAENACRNSSVETTIVRTMWLYGRTTMSVEGKKDFTSWVRAQLKKGAEFPVVEDEYGNPTHYDDLAYALLKCVETPTPQLVHAAGSMHLSRLEWAKTIARLYNSDDKRIKGMKAEDLARKAPRPLNSGLTTDHPQLEGITLLTPVAEGEKRTKVLAER